MLFYYITSCKDLNSMPYRRRNIIHYFKHSKAKSGSEKIFDIMSIVGHLIANVPPKAFEFQGRNYDYFYHLYNTTWKTERAVEVPIVWDAVQQYKESNKRILEVGNVMSHYFSPIKYDIVDKYEKMDGVINNDVVDFHPSEKYDLIICISTLEHVGWDEEPQDPMKVIESIKNLKNCLAPKGKLIVTIPLGYNHPLDVLIKEEKLGFTSQGYLKKISWAHKWKEVGVSEINNARYGYPYPYATAVMIGSYQK
jgi:SAM-dependent methyltransferase